MLLVALALPMPLHAQLLAPGKLATPHASLDGIRKCTSCHALGSAGAADDRCLTCHDLIRTRRDQRRGYHARLVDRTCASCHKDHFGREFELVRLDTSSFDHNETGWTLRGAHTETVQCRDCHRMTLVSATDVRAAAARSPAMASTFLGLGTTCESCHERDQPHGTQFAKQECRDCHVENKWADLGRFDHARARYALTGLHRRVGCDECHLPTGQPAAVRYRGISFGSCASCHTDPHAGAMGKACADCHATGGWDRVNGTVLRGRFDHSATRFPLVGRHATVDCAVCHDRARPQPRGIRMAFANTRTRASLARPIAERCGNCHVDYHEGVFADRRAGCESCHDEEAWLPTSYGIDRHNRDARFRLTGAHLVAPCTACHGTAQSSTPVFRLGTPDCVACHAKRDPHAGQFGNADCATCHDTGAFAPSTFDHATSRFALDGAHARGSCNSCHVEQTVEGARFRRYRPLRHECRDCHGSPQ